MNISSLKDMAVQTIAQAIRKGCTIELEEPSKTVLLNKIINVDLHTAALFLSESHSSDMRLAALRRFVSAHQNETQTVNLHISNAAALCLSDDQNIRMIGYSQIFRSLPAEILIEKSPIERHELFSVLSSPALAFSKYIDNDKLKFLSINALKENFKESLSHFLKTLSNENVIDFYNEKSKSLVDIIEQLFEFAYSGPQAASYISNLLMFASHPIVRNFDSIQSLVNVACQSSKHANNVEQVLARLNTADTDELLPLDSANYVKINQILNNLKGEDLIEAIQQLKTDIETVLSQFKISQSIEMVSVLLSEEHSDNFSLDVISKIALQGADQANAIKKLLEPILQEPVKKIIQNNPAIQHQIKQILNLVTGGYDLNKAATFMKQTVNVVLNIQKMKQLRVS
ncbi:MAG: hypothetical protein V4629_07990 [Pseudomonadota bacterium]